MKPSRLAGNFLRTKYPSKLRRHFTNIDQMALQGLPMFVRQEISEFILRGMGVVSRHLNPLGYFHSWAISVFCRIYTAVVCLFCELGGYSVKL